MLSVKQQYFLAFVLILAVLIVGKPILYLNSKVNNMKQFHIGSEKYYTKNGTLFKSEAYSKFKDYIVDFQLRPDLNNMQILLLHSLEHGNVT